MLEHNNTILVSDRTIDGFAQSIVDIYNNPKKLKNIKQKSRDVALKYTWKRTAELIQNVYEKI